MIVKKYPTNIQANNKSADLIYNCMLYNHCILRIVEVNVGQVFRNLCLIGCCIINVNLGVV